MDASGNCVQCTDDSHCTEDGQTCDTSTGSCVEASSGCDDIGGVVKSVNGKSFCWLSLNEAMTDNAHASSLCLKYGMSLPSMSVLCPNWTGGEGVGKCSNFPSAIPEGVDVWTSSVGGTEDDLGIIKNLFYTVGYGGNVWLIIEDGMKETLCEMK